MKDSDVDLYVTATDPKVQQRQRVEIKIVAALVESILEKGYSLRVFQGDEDSPGMRKDLTPSLKDLFTCDDDRIAVYQDGQCIGWVYLVYGNDGFDVVSDYTTNLEFLMQGEVKRLQEFYGE